MPSLSSVIASNAAFKPSYLPVAIFVGGTSGIGQGLVETFANHTKGNAHIIIIGRNRASADSIFASLPPPSKEGGAKHEFIQCDVSLLSQIHSLQPSLPPKVNLLFMSPGFLSMAGFTPTPEGNDRRLSVHYYARFAFTRMLIPALEKARAEGEDAKVLTVLGAGKGSETVDLEDLGLKKTYSAGRAGLQGPAYNDLMVDIFARKYPTLSFIHSYPGVVRSSLMSSSNSPVLRAINPIINTLGRPWSFSIQEAGEYQLYGVLKAKYGELNRIGSRGEDYGSKGFISSDDTRTKFWEHCVEVDDGAGNAS